MHPSVPNSRSKRARPNYKAALLAFFHRFCCHYRYAWCGVTLLFCIYKASRMDPAKNYALVTERRPPSVLQISVLGERNSGTRWLVEHIAECFNHSGVEVRRHLTRYKHWFQYDNSSKYLEDTLVLAQFRNPYDWFRAMQSVPHHAPMHMGLHWDEFIVKEWTMERYGLDLVNSTGNDTVCQEEFSYQEVISCNIDPIPLNQITKKLRFSENQPFYEHYPNGTPFRNIMELRSQKIRNFVEDIPDYDFIHDLWLLQYEQLLDDGTEELLQRIEKVVGFNRTCDAFEPQPNRRVRNITRNFLKFVTNKLDWETEALIGYAPRDVKKY